MTTKTIVIGPIGCLFTGSVRRLAFLQNLQIVEDKGWMDSHFRLTGDVEDIDKFVSVFLGMQETLETAEKLREEFRKRWWLPWSR